MSRLRKRGPRSAEGKRKRRERQEEFRERRASEVPGAPVMVKSVDRDGQIAFRIAGENPAGLKHRVDRKARPRDETFEMPPIEPDD